MILKSATIILITAVFGLLGLVFLVGPTNNANHDLLTSTMSPFTQPSQDVVLVTVTEETLEKFAYRSPVDRAFLAKLVNQLAAAKPKVIGLDLLFDQPTNPDKDQTLRSALINAQVPVVLASAGSNSGLTQRQQDYLRSFTKNMALGDASLIRDAYDGIVRNWPETEAAPGPSDQKLPLFSEAILAASDMAAKAPAGPIAFFRSTQWEAHRFASYPAHQVEVLPKRWFHNKLVLIGVDLPQQDRHGTPFTMLGGVETGSQPGVSIHAHMISQMLAGHQVRQLNQPATWMLYALVFAAVCFLIWRPTPVVLKPLIIVTAVTLLWAAGAITFAFWNLEIVAGAQLICLVLGSSCIGFIAWKRDSDRTKYLKLAFGRYVSPAVVDALLAEPERLRLGGERRTITSIFTDVEGFTAFSEQRSPEEVGQVLNRYLEDVCALFVKHGATIDKLVGDGVVGFFGAPIEQDDQAQRAVLLALEIREFARKFQFKMQSRGVDFGATRIGIHTGEGLVGNFGGKRFFDYTAIGDIINTAARLEGANKYLGTNVCVSEDVKAACPEMTFRPAATVTVSGRRGPMVVYEPQLPAEVGTANIAAYQQAYTAMAQGDKSANDLFSKLKDEYPNDRLIQLHAERLSLGASDDVIELDSK